jgi:hypothetical protein
VNFVEVSRLMPRNVKFVSVTAVQHVSRHENIRQGKEVQISHVRILSIVL